MAAGARTHRHAHVMSRDLRRDPAPAAWLAPTMPDGYRLTAVDRPARELAPVAELAYPPGHPDHRPEPEEPELEEIMSGRLLGPLLPSSALALDADGEVAGAILVNDSDGEPPFGGPWLAQIFRRPDAPGLGTGAPAPRAGVRDPRRPRGDRPGGDRRQSSPRALRGARLRRGPRIAERGRLSFAVRRIAHLTEGCLRAPSRGYAPASRRRPVQVVRSVKAAQAKTLFCPGM